MSNYPDSNNGFTRQPPPPGWHPVVQENQLPKEHQKNPHSPTLTPRNHSVKPPRDEGKKKNSIVRLLIMVSAAALIIVLVFIGVRSLRERQIVQSIAPYNAVYGPNLYINDVPLTGLTPQAALDKLRTGMQNRMTGWNLALTYQGHLFINLNYGTLGLTVTDEELYGLLNEAWIVTHSGDIYEQKAAIDRLTNNALKTYTEQTEMDGTMLQSILEQIAPYVNRDPVDAAILTFLPDETDPFIFRDEQWGVRLEVNAARGQILSMAVSGQSGSFELAPESIEPAVKKAELEQTVKLRTSISTSISASSTENRNHNIRLSFSKFNGMVLKPGQTFSFNDVVGPRTLKAGFAEALEYVYGDLVTGIGGGVCQASTTLYQAALTAGLTITKRLPHSDRIDYAEMGQDATVYLTGDREIDFQFKNSTPGNIYLTAHVKSAKNNSKRLVAEIKMYGLSLGDGVSYRLRSDIVETIPPPEQKKLITDMTGLIVKFTDEEKLKSRAQEGYVIATYLEKYVNGTQFEQPKLISSDTFRAKPAEYWIGNTVRGT